MKILNFFILKIALLNFFFIFNVSSKNDSSEKKNPAVDYFLKNYNYLIYPNEDKDYSKGTLSRDSETYSDPFYSVGVENYGNGEGNPSLKNNYYISPPPPQIYHYKYHNYHQQQQPHLDKGNFDYDDALSAISGGSKGLKSLLGLKAIKKFGFLKAMKAGFLLSPIIIPIILGILLPIVLIILLFVPILPVPVVSFNPAIIGRSFEESSRKAKEVLASEECIERISCEISRFAKSYKIMSPNWIERLIENNEKNFWIKRISTGIKKRDNCAPLNCSTLLLNYLN